MASTSSTRRGRPRKNEPSVRDVPAACCSRQVERRGRPRKPLPTFDAPVLVPVIQRGRPRLSLVRSQYLPDPVPRTRSSIATATITSAHASTWNTQEDPVAVSVIRSVGTPPGRRKSSVLLRKNDSIQAILITLDDDEDSENEPAEHFDKPPLTPLFDYTLFE